MEAELILENIFGKHNVMEMRKILPKTSNTNILSTTDSIEIVKTYFRYVLVQSVCKESLIDDRIGRIGPKKVNFDLDSCVGLFFFSTNKKNIIAKEKFCTVRANTGVYKDKWMYEVQLGSSGIMQIGWATLNCKFNVIAGVGDVTNSYSYDGNRIKKWNVKPTQYGEQWLPGDIIGCTIDMNEGIISYYRNGRSLGKAFENISMGPGMAYFPAISMTFTENLTAIFGDIPFRYPIEDYQPIQIAPEIEISQASFIIHWINQILDYMIQLNGTSVLADNSMTVQAYLNCILEDLIKQLTPLLAIQYIIEVVFIPFLYDITDIRSVGAKILLNSNTNRIKVMTFLDLLWTFLEDKEVTYLLGNVISLLYSLFRHISFQPEYSKQYDILALLINLCLHTPTRHYYLNYELFDHVQFFNFIYIKPMDDMGLENIIPEPWWETDPIDEVINSKKLGYFKACENIKLLIKDVEMIQVWFLKILLTKDDATATKPSSRSIFVDKFQNFVYDNFVRTTVRHVPLVHSLCSFQRLLTVFRDLWKEEIGIDTVHIPCLFFYDETINYFDIDRLGGVLSYLKRTYKQELIKILGPRHKAINSNGQSENQSRPARRMNFLISEVSFSDRNVENNMEMEYTENENQLLSNLESANKPNSLLILLDSLILFYHTTVRKQVSKLGALQENILQVSTALSESKKQLIFITKYSSDFFQIIRQELLNTLKVFDKRLCKLSRKMAWVRATVFSEEKLAEIGWFLNVVAETLYLAGKKGNMFSFVPQFYLNALSDLCNAVRTEIHSITPFQVIPDHAKILLQISEFLCRHLMNPLIINVNSKQTLILIFAIFVSHPLTLNALESVTFVNRQRIIRKLLKPPEDKCWAHTSWILMRFWKGHGFAFRYEEIPRLNKKSRQKSSIHQASSSHHPKPCPSEIFQLHIKDTLLEKPKNTELFLNCFLNHINWAFSEFIGIVHELYDWSLSTENIFITSMQLRICATCFEITVVSLRVLEMFCFLAPTIFTSNSSNCETLLCRLFQLLCQILKRMSLKNNAFQKVLSWSVPDLAVLNYFPLLTAVIGILLLILKNDMLLCKPNPKMIVSRVTRLLLIEPSFQISSLYFVLGEVNLQFPETNKECEERFSLLNYLNNENFEEDWIKDEEINQVRGMLNYLDYCNSHLPNLNNLTDDENLCTICYAYPKDTKFIPCGHMTCHKCINRHLLNTKECFFCKGIINQVVNINDTSEN